MVLTAAILYSIYVYTTTDRDVLNRFENLIQKRLKTRPASDFTGSFEVMREMARRMPHLTFLWLGEGLETFVVAQSPQSLVQHEQLR